MTWQFVLAGLGVGLLVGMTGMGGGSLMTPILILLFGFNAKTAVGTDILHGAVFKSFGAARHRLLGTVHARLATWMLVGSVPLSLVGVEIANNVGDNSMSKIQKIVGGALILGGAGFLARTFIKPHTDDGTFHLSTRDKVIAIGIGAFGGFIVGLTSVGSGTFFGLAMLLPTRSPHRRWSAPTCSMPRSFSGSPASAPPPRRRRHACDGLAARRLHPRRADRLEPVDQGAGARAAGRIRPDPVLSGIKLVNAPEANYIVAVGLGGGAIALAWWLVRQYKIRQRRLALLAPPEAA